MNPVCHRINAQHRVICLRRGRVLYPVKVFPGVHRLLLAQILHVALEFLLWQVRVYPVIFQILAQLFLQVFVEIGRIIVAVLGTNLQDDDLRLGLRQELLDVVDDNVNAGQGLPSSFSDQPGGNQNRGNHRRPCLEDLASISSQYEQLFVAQPA
nr:unknown [Ipomoea trifida]